MNYLICLFLNSESNQTKAYGPYWRTWWLKVARALPAMLSGQKWSHDAFAVNQTLDT